MDKDTALDLALEALERYVEEDEVAEGMPGNEPWVETKRMGEKAIAAIKQARAQPAPVCTRSHPHENMDALCELRTEIARLTNENARLKAQPAPVQSAERGEPVAWKWHQAPVKTSWGHDMVVADLAIDKDNTVSVYCERDQTAKVEAMFFTPPAGEKK